MARFSLNEPVQRFPTSGALTAENLFVKLAAGVLALADENDENAVGVGLGSVAVATDINQGIRVRLLNAPGGVEVIVAAGVTLAAGDIAYAAAGGKVADTGTVRRGLCLSGAGAGELVEVLPDCGFALVEPE